MNRQPLYEYQPHEFSAQEKRLLAAAGWAAIPADDLVETATTIDAAHPPEIERATYLTRELLARRLFAERRRAYAFAASYVALADAGTEFRLIVWDWE